ncbi:MAG TPA: PAS domain-containing protein [Thermoanaerobaculia bacterium]|jgi:photoactive yellow protein|nr:PAS domain-containing protein [Thermoanaerobaculia bacterium]
MIEPWLGADELELIAEMSEADLDGLPFGAIRLGPDGSVLSYNATEATSASRRREDVIGRNFFSDIAPCTDVQEFAGRFHEGIAKQRLHASFPYRFDFKMRPRHVIVTLFYSSQTSSGWVFIRDEPAP